MKQKSSLQKIAFACLLILCSIFSCTAKEEQEKQTQAPAVEKTHIVEIQQMKFSPAVLTVNEGDSVTWINKDIVDHNVTEEASKLWASENLPSGKQWSTVVKESANYLCTLHPVMKGSVIVR